MKLILSCGPKAVPLCNFLSFCVLDKSDQKLAS